MDTDANGVDENEQFSHNSQTQGPSEETWDSAFGQDGSDLRSHGCSGDVIEMQVSRTRRNYINPCQLPHSW
ncbi:hypothetical protein E4U58_005749 [Claviceps cyperi]|nr:hypothetical protein E4U58_005749 [Claviceps cyperi]